MDATTERKHIKIVSVGTPKTVGNSQVTQFKGEGEDIVFEAWGTIYLEVIKVGTEIDAEITHSEKEVNGNIYRHHRVSQIYVNGEPIRKGSQGNRRNWGKSAEEIESVENQTKAQIITQLWIAQKLLNDCDEVRWLKNWLPKLKEENNG